MRRALPRPVGERMGTPLVAQGVVRLPHGRNGRKGRRSQAPRHKGRRRAGNPAALAGHRHRRTRRRLPAHGKRRLPQRRGRRSAAEHHTPQVQVRVVPPLRPQGESRSQELQGRTRQPSAPPNRRRPVSDTPCEGEALQPEKHILRRLRRRRRLLRLPRAPPKVRRSRTRRQGADVEEDSRQRRPRTRRLPDARLLGHRGRRRLPRRGANRDDRQRRRRRAADPARHDTQVSLRRHDGARPQRARGAAWLALGPEVPHDRPGAPYARHAERHGRRDIQLQPRTRSAASPCGEGQGQKRLLSAGGLGCIPEVLRRVVRRASACA